MIEEDYVSFETAKLLKEKEFNGDVNCTHVYTYGRVVSKDYFRDINELEEYVQAPTLQMAMKWLMKVHEIFIRPNISFLYPIRYYCEIFCFGDNLKTQHVHILHISDFCLEVSEICNTRG